MKNTWASLLSFRFPFASFCFSLPSLSLFLPLFLFIYLPACVCVCVCSFSHSSTAPTPFLSIAQIYRPDEKKLVITMLKEHVQNLIQHGKHVLFVALTLNYYTLTGDAKRITRNKEWLLTLFNGSWFVMIKYARLLCMSICQEKGDGKIYLVACWTRYLSDIFVCVHFI